MCIYLCAVNIFYVGIYIPLRQYRACVGMSSEWKYRCHYITEPIYDPAIRDPYLVSCTFYTCWRSLYSLRRIFDLLVSPPFLLFIQRGSNPSIDVDALIFIILTHYPIPFSTLISQLYYSITILRFATKKLLIWPVSSMYIHVHVLLLRIDLQ